MRGAAPAAAGPLVLDRLTVRFPVGARSLSWRQGRRWLTAVDDVTLAVEPGRVVGLVGESGCGKSTLARVVAGLLPATSGGVSLGGQVLGSHRDRPTSRRIQMVFQDPMSSLNPHRTVRSVLAEVLRVHRVVADRDVTSRLEQLMEMVELPPALLDQRPRSLSGGQRQRVGIARALAPEPELVVLDEAIAALDVSVQAAVLDLLRRLRTELGLSMVFISHDLSAVRGLCDDVAVMYLGRIVESGPVGDVLAQPRHPYTRALIAAEPSLDHPRRPGAAGLPGEPPSAIDRATGCSFRPRCPLAQDDCAGGVPTLEVGTGHDQACFHPLLPVDRTTV